MRNNTVRKMAVNAMVAALYFALSLPFMTPDLWARVQLRISEAFTLLPVFSATPPIAGLTLGCVLVNAFGAFTNANILGPLDIVFGSAATLLAAFLTYPPAQCPLQKPAAALGPDAGIDKRHHHRTGADLCDERRFSACRSF